MRHMTTYVDCSACTRTGSVGGKRRIHLVVSSRPTCIVDKRVLVLREWLRLIDADIRIQIAGCRAAIKREPEDNKHILYRMSVHGPPRNALITLGGIREGLGRECERMIVHAGVHGRSCILHLHV